jgi:APA family basic amino acid/polyamine antiporter
MARDIGSAAWLLVIWIVTGLITAAALSYGELAGMMPNAGGQFVHIQRATVVGLYPFMDGLFYGNSNGSYCCHCRTLQIMPLFFPVLDETLFSVGTSFVFSYQKSFGHFQYCFTYLYQYQKLKAVK